MGLYWTSLMGWVHPFSWYLPTDDMSLSFMATATSNSLRLLNQPFVSLGKTQFCLLSSSKLKHPKVPICDYIHLFHFHF